MKDLLEKIMKYESGELTEKEVIEFFAELIKDGLCWKLQGHYGRTAHNLIQFEIIDTKGELTQKGKNLLEEMER